MDAAGIRAVLFDMDGTMFDTERLWLEVVRLALDEMKLPGPAELYQNVLGMTGKPTSDYLVEAFQLNTPAKQERFSKLCQSYYERIFVRGRVKIKKGLLELLEYLQTQGIPWAVVTSSERWEVQKYFGLCDLTFTPEMIVSAESSLQGKPAPDPFLNAAKQLGVPAAECLVLEDSRFGIQAAIKAGMRAIMIPDLIVPDETDRHPSVEIVPDMTCVIRFLKENA